MRRALVFLLLGPLAVTIAVTMAILSPVRMDPFVELIAATIFIVTLPLSALVGVIDSCLARRLPVAERAGLTAAAGAIVPCMVLCAFAHSALAPSILLPYAICGAASMWLSALLADGSDLQQLSQGLAAALQARSSG